MTDVAFIGEESLTLEAPAGTRKRVPISVAVAALFLLAVVIAAIIGSRVAPFDPAEQDLLASLQDPSSEHWLGTDDLGRDVLSRVMAGARTGVEGPLAIALGSMLLGAVLGMLAGYLGGWVDGTVSRWIDLMYALPGLLIAIVIVGVLGGGYWIGVGILLIVFVPYNARIVRAAVLEQKALPYVEAARILGLSKSHIMTRHVLPNCLPVIVSAAVLNFAFALVSLAGLSFLGIGVSPGAADWGRMLAEGIPLVFENQYAAISPGVILILTAVAVNLVGDWLYEALQERSRLR